MTSAVVELRANPRHGDIREARTLSASAQALADRAAYIRRLRQESALGVRFVGPDLRRSAAVAFESVGS